MTWNQIAGARAIIEAGFRDFKVLPSQGTHFFQNLTAGNIGYFTVNPESGDGSLDWDWLRQLPGDPGRESVRHIQLDEPIEIRMSGMDGRGLILKPRTS